MRREGQNSAPLMACFSVDCIEDRDSQAAPRKAMEQSTLYDDGRQRLDVELRNTDRRIVVFFPHRFATAPLQAGVPLPRNYGGDFAERYGLNAAIIGLSEPDWFQHDGFPRLLGALERMCTCFSHVTFLGSSMGGYGAVSAASAIAADHVIAFSPVSNIDPAGYPADPRYEDDFARIGRFRIVTRHRAARYTITYDPADLDRRHVGNFAFPEGRTTRIGLPGAGHVTQRVIKEAGLLSRLTRDLLAEREVDRAMVRDLRRAVRETPSWLLNVFGLNLHSRPEVAGWALDRLKETGVFAHRYPRLERRLRRVRNARAVLAA